MQACRRYSTLQLLVLVLLAFCRFGQSQTVVTDCYTDCGYGAATEPGATCAQLEATINCHFINIEICGAEVGVIDHYDTVLNALLSCQASTTTTISSEAPSIPDVAFKCPNAVSQVFSSPPDPVAADITPEPHSCASSTPGEGYRQCSMFSFSHLRPFEGYRTGLETCVVPGEWYLFKHSDLTVVVESRPVAGLSHTQLTKVKVTFAQSSCTGEKSYVATINSSLPQTFTDGYAPNNLESALQLKHKGSVVSLLAVWIDTAIIIRKLPDGLSVTMRVPGDLSFFSDGLCRGCPRHAYFNVSAYTDIVRSQCPPEVNTNALISCFFLANRMNLIQLENDSYADQCAYNLFKTESLEITRSAMAGVAQDAEMLPDMGIVPVRPVPEEPLPTVPTSYSRTTRATFSQTTTRATVQPTVDLSAFGSAARLGSLNLLTIVGLAVVGVAMSLLR